MIQLLLAAALSAHAADAYKVLEPRAEEGKTIAFRMIRYEVPPNTAARVQVSLAPGGDCFDSSWINWTKGEVGEKKSHSINFDAWVAPMNGKRPEGCDRRKVKNRDGLYGGLHTVDLPAEKGGIFVVITYRVGTEVRVALNPGP